MDSVFLVLVTLCLFTRHQTDASQVLRLRGVPLSKTALYPADKDFQCLDGSLFMPFTQVNDDYCDCADGSDEPGTSACSNGSFYCENAGHRPQYIPSSWVNDGVCDCCDASDEYASGKSCVVNCHELGREARIEAQRAIELAKEGDEIRQDMITRGKQIKLEHQARLVSLRAEHEEAERIKKEKEILKSQAEEREKIALEKYKPAEPEPQASDPEEEEMSINEAEDYFQHLDSDSDGILTLAEIQVRQTFDVNRNGEVSEDEAKYFLNNKEQVTREEFVESAWANFKPYVMLEEGTFKPPNPVNVDTKEQVDHEEEQVDHEEEQDQELAKEEEEDADLDSGENVDDTEAEEEVVAPQYDEETQSLISEAEKGRELFKEAERSVRDLLAEIKRLEESVDRDYGPDEAFAPLDGQCFEYTDLEYIYTMCPFGKAAQKSKSGGNEIVLGHWEEWIGPEGNKYSEMKFERGLACWNGPTRSTRVKLTCGIENQILSVSEPSRCEYAMEFATPSVCHADRGTSESHDEL